MKTVDFGKTAKDYGKHRQGFPLEFFKRLQGFEIGLPHQHILDLGTGTGTVARGLALAGADVVGLDPSPDLIAEAQSLDQQAGVKVEYVNAKAEETGLAEHSFDVITAGTCWHWFDEAKAINEVKRLLKPQGKLVIAHYDWLSLPESVPVTSEQIMQRYAPDMQPGLFNGLYPQRAILMQNSGFINIETFSFDHANFYTHEAWCGRIRASQWIGARLAPEQVILFDEEHAKVLKAAFPHNRLKILHRCFVAVGTYFLNIASASGSEED